jgi:hypothetical protein
MISVSTLSTPSEWSGFLTKYAAASDAAEWPGNSAASEEQLVATETRLKVKLPPSYRASLSVSNGWRQASREIPVMQAVERIRWFRREHREWVQAYADPMQGVGPRMPAEQDYFNYGEDGAADWDVKHLTHTLCISDVGDSAVLLLNPMVIWPDGEWEAWFFANWLPGATRYHSFADWMSHELAELLDETFEHTSCPGELPTVYLNGPAKSKRRVRPREEILVLEVVLDRLKSKTRSQRIKAVQQLCRIGGQQAITALLNVLKNDFDYHVRCEAAEALGRLRAHESIETLIELATEETYVTSTAVQTLGNFDDEQSAQCLLKLVEEDGSCAGTAAYALARRKDSRGVAPLVQTLVSKDPRDQHTGSIAGRFIAPFEKPGYLALEPLVTHGDAEIRQRAILGILDIACLAKDKELKILARKLLEQCLEKETDGRLHQWLVGCVEVACKKKPEGSKNPFSGT